MRWEELFNRIKAVAKILAGVIIASFINVLVLIPIVFMTGMGILSLVLAIFAGFGLVALGAFIGGKWARFNVRELESIGSIAIGSAFIYLTANLIISAAGSILLATYGGVSTNFWMQVAQISVQSFAIYIASHSAMKQSLPKKEI